MSLPSNLTFDKLKGLLIGGALGDALGVPHEFRHLKHNVYTGKLEYQAYTFNRFTKQKTYMDIGQVSDDTEMSMCLLKSIIETMRETLKGNPPIVYSPEKTVMKYIEWANSGMSFMGRNTRYLFKGIKTYNGYLSRFNKMENPQNAQSNGALMRCGVLSIFSICQGITGNELFKIIKNDCYLTNPNKISRMCNRILIKGIFYCFMQREKNDIISKISQCTEPDIINAWKNENLRVDGKNKGWCVFGLVLAFKALEKFDTFKEGIDWIINQGGDTDTNACIGGYLLGAYHGFEKMYSNNKENIDILYECETVNATNPRPRKYWVKSALCNFDISALILEVKKIGKLRCEKE